MFIREAKNYIRDKIWVFLKARWKLRSGITIKIENDSDWFVFNEIFTNKEYDEAFRLMLPSNSSANPLILDLGANVGYFTLKIADELLLAGFSDFQIILLEASPANFQVLQQRMDQSLLKEKVKVFLGLAGHKTGSSKVVHSKQHYGHSSFNDNTTAKTAVVDYLDIETLIADPNKRIDFLKCDIEGSEEIFINAYIDLLKKVDNAVFEFHAGECNVDNCRAMLQQVGLKSKGTIKTDPPFQTSVEIFSRQ